MKVFIIGVTIYIARVSEQSYIVRVWYAYIYILILMSLVIFRRIQIFAKGLKALLSYALCILRGVCANARCNTITVV